MKYMNRKFATALVLGISAATASCGTTSLRGNGIVTDESRTVGDFSGVDVSNDLQVNVSLGPTSVTVHLDQNLQQYLEASVSGTKLVLGVKNGFQLQATQPILVTVTSPTLVSFTGSGSSQLVVRPSPGSLTFGASGSSKITAQDIAADAIDVDESGSSSVILTGTGATTMKAVVASASTLTSSLAVKDFTFDASGGSVVAALVTDSVKGDASGSSKVTIRGSSTHRDTTASGAAVVTFDP